MNEIKKIILIINLAAGISYSQFVDIKDIETELAGHIKKIDYWANFENPDKKINKYDSLVMENTILTQKLYDILKSNRNSVSYDFPALSADGINIAVSDDRNLRIFSWDTKTGGTMHMFNSVLQYSSENRVSAKIINNVFEHGGTGAGYNFPLIYQVKPYTYLVIDKAVYSTKDVYMGIRGICIEGEILNDTIGIFKTKQGQVNEVGTGYDFFSVADLPTEKRPEIIYDAAKQEVSVPMTDFENDLTDRYIKFRYNGSYFIKEMLSDIYFSK
jgi:hypothetical protein